MPRAAAEAARLRTLVQSFVREFGLLAESQTPCGQPLHTSLAHALMILRQAGEPGLTQSELSRQLGIDKSNTSRLIQQLVRNRQARATPAPAQDGRIKIVQLTPKGSRLAATIDEASRHRFAELLQSIAPGHRRAVLDGLSHLTRAVEQSRDGRQMRPMRPWR